MKKYLFLSLVLIPLTFTGCKKKDGDNSGGGGFNIFSINDDKELGAQVKADIMANPGEFPIIAPSSNPAAYDYLYEIRNDILNSGAVKYKNDFAWEVYIVKRDDIQNAFCTPGGYIYVYTGLIKYLDNKSSLAGVMGHEIAHADRRHSTEQLTKIYGIQTLLDIVLGNNQGLISQVATQLVTLKFSRDNEKEADDASVEYLCPIGYQSDGAASFFEKLIAAGASTPPEFLSTHPNPDNRVENIKSYAASKSCNNNTTQTEEETEYAAFKSSL